MLATLPGDRSVKEGTVVAGTRTIPVVVKEALVQKAEALCKEKPIVTILPMAQKKVHLVVTGSEVFTGRIKDGFGPIVSKKSASWVRAVDSVKLAPDDPDVIAGDIRNAKQAGADVILVSGGMSVDPDDKTPEGIRRSGAKVETHGFPVLPGSMFVMAYLGETPVMGFPAACCTIRLPPLTLSCRACSPERKSRAPISWRWDMAACSEGTITDRNEDGKLRIENRNLDLDPIFKTKQERFNGCFTIAQRTL